MFDNLLPSLNVKSPFMLYGGGLFGIIYLVSLVITISLRRRCPVVVPLTTPPPGERFFEYIISIQTSLKPFSGLSSYARVHLQLLGEFHDSSSFLLKKNKVTQDILHRGALDIFVIHTRYDLGSILGVGLHVTSPKIIDTWRPAIVSVYRPSTSECWISWDVDKIVCKQKLKMTIPLDYYEVGMERGCGNAIGQYFIFLGVKHLLISHFISSVRFGVVSAPVFLLLFYFALACIFTSTLIIYTLGQNAQIEADVKNFSIQGFEWRTIDMGIGLSVVLSWIMEMLVKSIRPVNMDRDYIFIGLQELKMYNIEKERDSDEEEGEEDYDYDEDDDEEEGRYWDHVEDAVSPASKSASLASRAVSAASESDDSSSGSATPVSKSTSQASKSVSLSSASDQRKNSDSSTTLMVDVIMLPLNEFATHFLSDIHTSLSLCIEEGRGKDPYVITLDHWHEFLKKRLLREIKFSLNSENLRRDSYEFLRTIVAKKGGLPGKKGGLPDKKGGLSDKEDVATKPVTKKTGGFFQRFTQSKTTDKEIKYLVVCKDCKCSFCHSVEMTVRRQCCLLLDLVTRAVLRSCHDCLLRQQAEVLKMKNISRAVDHVKLVITYIIEQLQYTSQLKTLNLDLKNLPLKKSSSKDAWKQQKDRITRGNDPETLAHIFVKGIISVAVDELQHTLNVEMNSLPPNESAQKPSVEVDRFAVALVDDVYTYMSTFLYHQINQKLDAEDVAKTLDKWLKLMEEKVSDAANDRFLPHTNAANSNENLLEVFKNLKKNTTAGSSSVVSNDHSESKEVCACRGKKAACAGMSLLGSLESEPGPSQDDIIRHSVIIEGCNCAHCKELKIRVKRHCTFVLGTTIKSVLRCCYEYLVEHSQKNEQSILRAKKVVGAVETMCSNVIEQFQAENQYKGITPKSGCCETGTNKSGTEVNPSTLAHIFLGGVITVATFKLQNDLSDELDVLAPLAPCLVCKSDEFIGSTGQFSEDFVAEMYSKLTHYLYTHYKDSFELKVIISMCKQWLELLEKKVLGQLRHNLSVKVQKSKKAKGDDVIPEDWRLAFKLGKQPFSYSTLLQHVTGSTDCDCFYCQQVRKKIYMNAVPVLEKASKDCYNGVKQNNFDKQFSPILSDAVMKMETICKDVIHWIKDPDQHKNVVSDADYKAFKGWDKSKVVASIPELSVVKVKDKNKVKEDWLARYKADDGEGHARIKISQKKKSEKGNKPEKEKKPVKKKMSLIGKIVGKKSDKEKKSDKKPSKEKKEKKPKIEKKPEKKPKIETRPEKKPLIVKKPILEKKPIVKQPVIQKKPEVEFKTAPSVKAPVQKKRPANSTLEEDVNWLVDYIVESSEFEINYQLMETSHVQDLCGQATKKALDEIWEFYQTPPYAFTVFLIQQKAIQKLISVVKLAHPDAHVPTLVRQNFSYALFSETEHHFASSDTLVAEAWLYKSLSDGKMEEKFVNQVKTIIVFRSIIEKVQGYVNTEADKVVDTCLDRACYILSLDSKSNRLAPSIMRGSEYEARVWELKEVLVHMQVECDLGTQMCFSRLKKGIEKIIKESMAGLASEASAFPSPSPSRSSRGSRTDGKSQQEGAVSKIQQLSKDLEPLTQYVQHVQSEAHKDNIKKLEKQLLKATRQHKEYVAINLQNIIDSYYVSNEIPAGYTEDELYVVEWAMTRTLNKLLPKKVRGFVLFLMFAITTAMMAYFVIKGSELTTPQAKEWVCLAMINVAIFGLVFEPLKIFLMNLCRKTWPYF